MFNVFYYVIIIAFLIVLDLIFWGMDGEVNTKEGKTRTYGVAKREKENKVHAE